MKKIIALFAIVSMFAFVACNNTPKEDPAAAAAAAQAEADSLEQVKKDLEAAEAAAAAAAAADTTQKAEMPAEGENKEGGH